MAILGRRSQRAWKNMRKEILFAIVAGVLFGLVISFGIWKANSTIKPNSASDTQNTNSTPVAQNPIQIGLTIARPQEYEIVNQNQVLISAITSPNSWVSISGEGEDYVIKSDANGAFEINVSLIKGLNEIIVTAFDNNGNQKSHNIPIIYSTEF
jgi:hypothetical protein